MLSLFPSLFDYSLYAPLLIRLTLGVIFLYQSRTKLRGRKKTKLIGTLEVVGALLLIIGLFTQAVALIFSIMLVLFLFHKMSRRSLFSDGVNYYFLMLVLCLSLLVTGAGVYAIDLPL